VDGELNILREPWKTQYPEEDLSTVGSRKAVDKTARRKSGFRVDLRSKLNA